VFGRRGSGAAGRRLAGSVGTGSERTSSGWESASAHREAGGSGSSSIGRSSSGVQEFRELVTWVDTENHTLLAVSSLGLCTVEPEGRRDADDVIHGRENTGAVLVVEVRESGIEAILERIARLLESGLCDGVVGAVEVESNDITNASNDLIVLVQEFALGADNDVVNLGAVVSARSRGRSKTSRLRLSHGAIITATGNEDRS